MFMRIPLESSGSAHFLSISSKIHPAAQALGLNTSLDRSSAISKLIVIPKPRMRDFTTANRHFFFLALHSIQAWVPLSLLTMTRHGICALMHDLQATSPLVHSLSFDDLAETALMTRVAPACIPSTADVDRASQRALELDASILWIGRQA
ncbi:hypothetical protein CVT25_007877 [Psilocybe cyanescens]|uniref:Uncharacterized protein n=1 Tax=Psilocybe cyanescens TaxID=93625 RepID=A0A409XVJ5_PSICY|nr:hypothetical protein CVT25_007877 [Psilocybe cyanescens]